MLLISLYYRTVQYRGMHILVYGYILVTEGSEFFLM